MGAFTDAEWELLSPAQQKYYLARKDLLQTALEDALIHEKAMRVALRDGKGVWLDSFEPLYPKERTAVLAELRKIWRLPPRPEDATLGD